MAASSRSTELARHLGELMAARKLVQMDVSSGAGIPQNTISRWLSALEDDEAVEMDAANEARLRNYLVATGWLIDGERPDRIAKGIAAGLLDGEARLLAGRAAQLRQEATPPAADYRGHDHLLAEFRSDQDTEQQPKDAATPRRRARGQG